MELLAVWVTLARLGFLDSGELSLPTGLLVLGYDITQKVLNKIVADDNS